MSLMRGWRDVPDEAYFAHRQESVRGRIRSERSHGRRKVAEVKGPSLKNKK